MIEYLTIPTKCPICGGDVEIKSVNFTENLYCLNPNCSGKLINRLDHFCGKKGLDIKGLSKMTLEKLINWGWIENFEDILQLQEHKAEWITKPGFGAASVTKILLNIEIATHPAYLWRVIAAAGIPQIGSTASKVLAQKFKTYAAFREAVKDKYDFTTLDDFGEVMCSELLNFNYTEIDNAVYYGINIAPVKEEKKNDSLEGMKICVTGKLKLFKNRSELKEKIESLGGKVVDSVTKSTNFLINNDIDSTSSKNKKAKELSIPILTEEQFFNLKEFME